MLCITRHMMGLSGEGLRIVCAAVIGGLWSMAAVCLMIKFEGWKIWIDLVTYCVITLVMWAVASGWKQRRKWLKGALVMWIVTMVLSGVSHVLWYHKSYGYAWVSGMIRKEYLLGAILFGIVLQQVVLQMIRIRRKYGNEIYKVRLTVNRRQIEMNGLFDSGNVLTDPYTGRMVHIVRLELLQKVLEKQENPAQMHYRLIPFHSVGEQEGLLPVIDVECMEVFDCKQRIYKDAATIGLYDGILTGTDSYDVLLNGALLRN